MPRGTLILTRSEIEGLLPLADYIPVVERAFALHAEGQSLAPSLMHIDCDDGEFHVKGGGLRLPRPAVAVKVNGGFFKNMERFGLPAIQGSIVLCDGESGYPLAFLESSEITASRTAAATAAAAKHLARTDAETVTVCGCGRQGRAQLRALTYVRPIRRAFLFDANPEAARALATEASNRLGIDAVAADEPGTGAGKSDIVVTSTPARKPFLRVENVRPGAFVAAIGADSPEKQELDPRILAESTVVVDILDQCAAVGELHHAIEAGLMSREDVHAELGDVIAGSRPGRQSPDERIVFDATGTALQDVAAALAVYEKAIERGVGLTIDLKK